MAPWRYANIQLLLKKKKQDERFCTVKKYLMHGADFLPRTVNHVGQNTPPRLIKGQEKAS